MDEVFCPLSRWSVLSAVIDVVAECVPNLEALSLDKNKLFYVDRLAYLGSKLTKLRILHLTNNKVIKTRFFIFMFKFFLCLKLFIL